MNVAQNVTSTVILFGMLALAGHPVLAEAADAGNGTSVFAQVQRQQEEKASSDQPADQPPAATRRGTGAGMMSGEQGTMDPKMMQMHGGASSGKMGGATGGMGQGMMGGGMGPMGPCPMMMARTDKDFSAEQVRDILEGHIAWTGNKRLKVGSVEQKDEESYVAEIVTVDDSLVQRLEVNRSTGAMQPID
jgi:hypothetical protein